MLVVFSATAKLFAFKFNGNKLRCLSLGKLANVDSDPMLFDNQSIAWCHSIYYLRVHLLSGKDLCLTPLAYHLLKGPYNILRVIIYFSFCYMLHLLFT